MTNDGIHMACEEDLQEILDLQHKAFREVGLAVGNPNIPALAADIRALQEEFHTNVILKYMEDGRILGSVRGNLKPNNSCYIGTLAVDPDARGKGIGRKLMNAIEEHFSNCSKYYLFTSPLTPHTSAMYRKMGYVETKRGTVNGTEMIFMEKVNAPAT